MNTMKTMSRTLIAISTVALLSACQKEGLIPPMEVNAELNLSYDQVAFTVPVTPVAGSVALDIGFDGQQLSDLLTANGYTLQNLKEVSITAATLHLVDQAGSFNAFQQMEIRMEADGTPAQVLAGIQAIPANANTVQLSLSGGNLMDLFRSTGTKLRITATTTAPIAQDLPLRAAITFRVVAGTNN